MQRITDKNINTVEYWDEFYKKGISESVRALDHFKFMNIVHHIRDGSMVLDIGCGDGEFCRVLKKERKNCRVAGIDFSIEAIKKAQRWSEIYNDDIIYYARDFREINKIFLHSDYVVSLETLEHLENPVELVETMADLLLPGGRAILTTPYLDHIPSTEHLWYFDYKDVEDMFNKFFSQVWVFPWAAGWSKVEEIESKKIIYYPGHWDTIMTLAIR